MKQLSVCLGYKAAQTLYYAIGEQAERIGLPLNTWLTINFSMTSIPAWDAVSAFQRFRSNHFNQWARRPKKGGGPAFPATYAYVFENERNGVPFEEIGPDLPHNVHCHTYLHMPEARQHDFSCRALEWVDYIAGSICPAGAVHIEFVTEDNGIKPYCLKGARRDVAEHFGAEYEPQGVIFGKRAGTSENIGPSARLAFDKAVGIDRKANMRFYRAA